jgi:hypothetical protein
MPLDSCFLYKIGRHVITRLTVSLDSSLRFDYILDKDMTKILEA